MKEKNRPVLNFLHITTYVLPAAIYNSDSLVCHYVNKLPESFFTVVRNKYFRVLKRNSV
jgi:hypothetical protein